MEWEDKIKNPDTPRSDIDKATNIMETVQPSDVITCILLFSPDVTIAVATVLT